MLRCGISAPAWCRRPASLRGTPVCRSSLGERGWLSALMKRRSPSRHAARPAPRTAMPPASTAPAATRAVLAPHEAPAPTTWPRDAPPESFAPTVLPNACVDPPNRNELSSHVPAPATVPQYQPSLVSV